MAGDDNVDPWAATSWAALFQEAKDLGGRAVLVVTEGDQGFAVRPSARPVEWVLTKPTCSVSSGGPGVVEARSYLKCLDDRVLGDPRRMKYDELGERVWSRSETHNFLLTWEPDDSKWHVWTIPRWTCGNARWEARASGAIVPK